MGSEGSFIDSSSWPICTVRFRDRKWTDEDVEVFLSELKATYDSGELHGMVVDARIHHLMNAAQRQRLVEYMKDYRPQAEALMKVMAVVVTSAMVRGAYTAVTWVYKPFWDIKLVKTPAEAVDYVVTRLEEAGVPLSPQARLLTITGITDEGDHTSIESA